MLIDESARKWNNLQEVMNQAAFPRLITPSTKPFTASKCGWPKKIECFFDQEFEWITRIGTSMSWFRGPELLPLQSVSQAEKRGDVNLGLRVQYDTSIDRKFLGRCSFQRTELLLLVFGS